MAADAILPGAASIADMGDAASAKMKHRLWELLLDLQELDLSTGENPLALLNADFYSFSDQSNNRAYLNA